MKFLEKEKQKRSTHTKKPDHSKVEVSQSRVRTATIHVLGASYYVSRYQSLLKVLEFPDKFAAFSCVFRVLNRIFHVGSLEVLGGLEVIRNAGF